MSCYLSLYFIYAHLRSIDVNANEESLVPGLMEEYRRLLRLFILPLLFSHLLPSRAAAPLTGKILKIEERISDPSLISYKYMICLLRIHNFYFLKMHELQELT